MSRREREREKEDLMRGVRFQHHILSFDKKQIPIMLRKVLADHTVVPICV